MRTSSLRPVVASWCAATPRRARAAALAAAVVTAAPTPPALHAQSGSEVPPDSARRAWQQAEREARARGGDRTAGTSVNRVIRGADRASAFTDSAAARLLAHAREARIRQDATLRQYRARVTQRMTVRVGARAVGLQRLAFRGDNVAVVSWNREAGVWITPVGSRVLAPLKTDAPDGDIVDDISVPWFPGKEPLWIPSARFGVMQTEVDDGELVHPLARGAEAHYRYAIGDSITITMPEGQRVRLRELRVTARRPEWRLVVGSFWFDREGGQLVRAAYRLAADIPVWTLLREEEEREERREDALPGWVTAALGPARATLDAVTVEYGRYAGRFWLPRRHAAVLSAQVGPVRAPITLDERFDYEAVDGDVSIAAPADRLAATQHGAAQSDRGPDTDRAPGTTPLRADDADERAGLLASVGFGAAADPLSWAAARANRCRSRDSSYVMTAARYQGAIRVAYVMPCDERTLWRSAALPDAGVSPSDPFDERGPNELRDLLGLDLQPGWSPQRPTVRASVDLWRFNRVEGLSIGVRAEQMLGAGYTAHALARLGHADRVLNAELGLARSNGRRTLQGSVYRRLEATAPEWGNPLSIGPSLPALLFARDEGFYFRVTGLELGERRATSDRQVTWRVFHEWQRSAGDSGVVDTWSFGRVLGIGRFGVNVNATPMRITGLASDWARTFGEDPGGLRLTTAVRAEGGTGTLTYVRGAADVSATRPVGRVALALAVSAGSSVGRLPPQRGWLLGGVRTVRGHAPASAVGNAFWLTRLEVGSRSGTVRAVGFGDVGWAGDRDAFASGRTLRSAGAGVSFLNGLLRLDAAHDLSRRRGWRTDLYLEAPI